MNKLFVSLKIYSPFNKRSLLFIFSALFFFLTSCKQTNVFQGYVEGRYTYLSSLYTGKLEKLNVRKGNQVKKDQTLFTLDLTPETLSVKNSTAQLEAAQGTLTSQKLAIKQAETSQRIAIAQKKQAKDNFIYWSKQFTRAKSLLAGQAITQAEFDQTKNNYQQADKANQIAQKNVQQAEISLKQAKENVTITQANISALNANVLKNEWDKVQKVIVAPADGFVFDTYYSEGEIVQVAKPVVSVLLPENIYVLFFVPETTLAQIRVGDPVQISCNNCTQPALGQINYISPNAEFTSPLIYSDHEKEKLMFRVEASFPQKQAAELKPGLPVNVKLQALAQRNMKRDTEQ